MNAGFRKSALVAYLALCIYLLAQPAPANLSDRANTLDKQLASEGRAALSPALATALQMPVKKVAIYLSLPDTKPSDLVFAKLLEKCGARAEKETPAETIVQAGIPPREILAYFDTIEKTVTETLSRDQKVEVQVAVHPSGLTAALPLVHAFRQRAD